MISQPPHELKLLRPYIHRGNQMEKVDAVITYYCLSTPCPCAVRTVSWADTRNKRLLLGRPTSRREGTPRGVAGMHRLRYGSDGGPRKSASSRYKPCTRRRGGADKKSSAKVLWQAMIDWKTTWFRAPISRTLPSRFSIRAIKLSRVAVRPSETASPSTSLGDDGCEPWAELFFFYLFIM